MKTHKRHKFWPMMAALLIATLACNLPGSGSRETASPTPEANLSDEGVATATFTPTVEEGEGEEEITPTVTPTTDSGGDGDGEEEEACLLESDYVADVTVPDNTEFAPSTAFTKTWRINNSGNCEWETGTLLVFVSGDAMSGPASVPAPVTAVGANTDINVNFTSPASPGTYKSNWQLQSPEGVRYGATVYVQIVVPAPDPDPADLVITALSVDTGSPTQGVPLNIVATLRNNGDSTANNVRWAWRVCPTCSYIEGPGNYDLGPGEQVDVSMPYEFSGWSTYSSNAWVDSREDISESNEGNNTRDLTIPVSAAPSESATLHTVSGPTGDLSSGGSSSQIRAGIAPAGNGIRGFITFDLSALSGLDSSSTIESATLDLSNYSGNCFEWLHPLLVQQVNYGATRDYPSDYNAGGSATLLSAASEANLFSPLNVQTFLQNFVSANGAGQVQLRLHLDGDDAGSAFQCMMQWPDPVLNVTYRP
ncbi:MAG: hypothetical protein DWQ07_08610 [Chloroflexi bacterium]|nr:MAG: hypothetical protein DWQ07_08610 [Chloroflexota bacterium]MBL1193227.1 hypothetical protein [Chloroflexota bacterium]NOH10522.1 hypothetical protein [Chloroflexota bacterium]